VIPVGVTGRIVSGNEQQGYYVLVEQDPSGFFVFTSTNREFERGPDEEAWDDWVATREDLAAFWEHRAWVVEWFDESPATS
jgi:hypothetical protein